MATGKVIHYDICSAHDHIQLTGLVNEAIQKGYIPHGDVFQRQYGENDLVHQPIVFIGIKKPIKAPLAKRKRKI